MLSTFHVRPIRRATVFVVAILAVLAVTTGFGLQVAQHQTPAASPSVHHSQRLSDTNWTGLSHHGAASASWCHRCATA